MVYLSTSQDWLHQSALLLQARPTTTIVTTKYRIEKKKAQSRRKRADHTKADKSDTTDATANSPAPTADITFKTWDPVSGVALKYRTNKAQEVGRLFGSLGRISRGMTGTGDVLAEDTTMLDAPAPNDEVLRTQSPAPNAASNTAGGSGANKKKKKGKK